MLYEHQLDKLNSFPAIAFELYSLIARALGCNSGVASLSLTIDILTVSFSAGTRNACFQ